MTKISASLYAQNATLPLQPITALRWHDMGFTLTTSSQAGWSQRFLQHQMWQHLSQTIGTHQSKQPKEKNSFHIAFLPDQKADILIPLLLADRNKHLARNEENKRKYADFKHILVPGQWHRRRLLSVAEFRENIDTIEAVGSLRIDALRKLQENNLKHKIHSNKKVILLAPTNQMWRTKSNDSFGIGKSGAKEIRQLIEKYCDLRYTPHPANRYNKAPITKDLIDADLVISDCSSVIFEAWALGKPVAFPRWLFGKTLIEKMPDSAEAYVLKNRIGLHLETADQLLSLISDIPEKPCANVENFMIDFLETYHGGNTAENIANAISEIKPSNSCNEGLNLQKDLKAKISIKDWSGAEEIAASLVSHYPKNPENYNALAISLKGQKKWWQEVEALKALIEHSPTSNAKHFFRLGQAQEQMRWNTAAAESYSKAIELKGSNVEAQWYYLLGYTLETKGHDGSTNKKAAKEAYALAIAADKKLGAKKFGIGVFHQARNYWDDAAIAYSTYIKQNNWSNATLYCKAGFAYDRVYDWAQAERFYSKAVLLTPNNGQWYYRLGFVQERQGHFNDAVEAYTMAIKHSTRHYRYWIYRLGYVQEKTGDIYGACQTFLTLNPEYFNSTKNSDCNDKNTLANIKAENSLELEKYSAFRKNIIAKLNTKETPPENFSATLIDYALFNCEMSHNWSDAALYYEEALNRTNDHDPKLYYALGQALTFAGEYARACKAFRNYRILQRPHGRNESTPRSELKIKLHAYAEYLEVLPVEPKTILFESFNGTSLTCNPYALYRHIANNSRFQEYRFVWTCNDTNDAPEDIRNDPRVALVRRESDLYLRYLATCQYLINNSGFPPYFIRKDEQKYLATWHGTPLKTLGKKQKYKFFDHKRTQRNFLQSTHIISPNPHTTNVYLDDYDLRGIYGGSFAETGYPRIDRTINISAERHKEILRDIGLDGDRPIVFYAPTWRGTLQDVSFDVERLRHDIQKFPKNADIIFRGHSLMEKALEGINIGCKVVPKEIDSNEILAVIDVLITDYSSVFFDFIPRNKPIILYAYDEDEYLHDRGLYFNLNDMPGIKVKTLDELIKVLNETLQNKVISLNGYSEAQKRFCPHEDGNVSEKVVSFFFDEDQEYTLDHFDNKKNVIFHPGGLGLNGIGTAFANLHKELLKTDIRPITIFEPSGPEFDMEKRSQFNQINYNSAFIPRFGTAVESFEEQLLRSTYGKPWQGKLNLEQKSILRSFYSREYKRMVGISKVDALVSYSGYDSFYNNVFLNAELEIPKNIILHNNMYSELTMRNPSLNRVFESYSEFDKLLSVSHQTSDINRENLSTRFNIAPEKFSFVDNTLDFNGIANKASEELTSNLKHIFDTNSPVFITIGRLSVEKNQSRLIYAFSKFIETNPQARLVVLGDGPLRNELMQLIHKLKLNGKVFLEGYISNPYPALKRADCFILPSDHEGQPMVLLEALILNKKIIATDIPGNRGVLEGRGGLLVACSESGLLGAMHDFNNNALIPYNFDPISYQRLSVEGFIDKIF